VPDLTQDLIGKLFGDRDYISQKLFEQLYQRGLELITRRKKKMKQQLVRLIDKILLRKRALIETVNDRLKYISQIEHSRLRSVWHFLVNLLAGLTAYTYLPNKTSLDLEPTGLPALPPAVF
jgi:Transposase DDE domain